MSKLHYFISKLSQTKKRLNLLNREGINNDILKWQGIYPAEKIHRSAPRVFGTDVNLFEKQKVTQNPDIGLYTVQNGMVKANSGWVFYNNQLLLESTWYTGAGDELEGRKFRLSKSPQKLEGTLLLLQSDFALNNYGHKLLDAFGRFHLIQKSGISLDEIDHILVPGEPGKRWIDVAVKLGIPENKLIWSVGYDFIRADRIIVTSYPGLRRNYPSWLVEYLRTDLGTNVAKPERRLYIQRNGRRKISNEAEILPILKDFGFEIYRPEESKNSIHDFCNAAAIIGGHGAGLSDIVFCRNGTPVLELIPSDHVYEYFYTIADSASLKYAYIMCKSDKERVMGSTGPSLSNYQVDPLLLKEALSNHFSSH